MHYALQPMNSNFPLHQKRRKGWDRKVHTDWQWPLSGVHSIMMVKSAQPFESGWDARLPLSLYLPWVHDKPCCGERSSWEGRYTPPISPLTLYVLCGWDCRSIKYRAVAFPSLWLAHWPSFFLCFGPHTRGPTISVQSTRNANGPKLSQVQSLSQKA